VTKVYSRATIYLHFHSNRADKSIPSSKASLGLSSAIRPAPLCFLNSKANKSKRFLASLAWGYLVLSAQPQFASLTIGLISQTPSSKASLKLYCAVSPAPKAPVSKLRRCDYVFCYPLRTDMMLLHAYILLKRGKSCQLDVEQACI